MEKFLNDDIGFPIVRRTYSVSIIVSHLCKD